MATTAATNTVDQDDRNNNITSMAKQTSPFLRLAAELRNRIYEYAFTGPVEIWPLAAAISPNSGYGIVLACKQTHHESLSLYYSTHTFRFSSHSKTTGENKGVSVYDRCLQWTRHIGTKSFSCVSQIDVSQLGPSEFARRFDLPLLFSQLIEVFLRLNRVVNKHIRSLEELKRRSAVLPENLFRIAICNTVDLALTGDFSVCYTSTPNDGHRALSNEALTRSDWNRDLSRTPSIRSPSPT